MKRVCFYPGLFCLTLGLLSCSNESDRKIRLADKNSNQAGEVRAVSSVLQVAEEDRHNLAILPFDNELGDTNLDWLRRGLGDMLNAELSQSPYLNIYSISDLYDDLNGSNQNVVQTARKSKIETILSGKFSQNSSGLKIQVELLDIESGEVFKSEEVEGKNLEQIFLMVDELSRKLTTNLRGDLQEQKITLAKMTRSVEAFKCYSEALENMEKYDFKEAEKCLYKAIEVDTTFAKAYQLLSIIKGRHHHDMEAYQKLLVKVRRHADKLSEHGRLMLQLQESELTGDMDAMLGALNGLLEIQPDDIQNRMQLARLLFSLKQNDRAIAEYEQILDMDPDQKMAYNYLAYLYARHGDFTTAFKYLDKYQAMAPDEPNPYDSRGELLMMAGRLPEAAEQCKKALAIKPSFDASNARLSQLYAEFGNLEKALDYAGKKQAEASVPEDKAKIHATRAALFWRFGKMGKAKKEIELAHKTAPQQFYPALLGGEMYQSIGDTAAANRLHRSFLTAFKRSIKGRQLTPYDLMGLAPFCTETELPEEKTILLLENALARESRELFKLQLSQLLGLLYQRTGDFEKAKAYCEVPRQEFYNLLTQVPIQGWSTSWKYSVEAIELEPLNENASDGFINSLFVAGQKAGRKDLEILAQFFKALYHDKHNRYDELAKTYQKTGSPSEQDWMVIGPFENHDGFTKVFPPEESIELDLTYKFSDRTLKWQHLNDDVADGYVDLRSALAPSAWAVGYGAVNIYSPDRRKVQLRIASDESCKLWLNDKQVWQAYRQNDAPLDQDIVTVYLHPGNNKLLIKVTNSLLDWGFYLRVTDDNGDGFDDIKFRSLRQKEPAVVFQPQSGISTQP